MTLQEQKEQLRKESWAAYRCPTFEFMWGKLQEKQAEIAEIEKKYQNVSSWNVDALKQINEHKSEIQKLHDHYQKQIGEWEQLLKAHEEYQSVLIDEIYSLAPIATAHGWKSALTEQGKACRERIESLKNQTPAPK